MIVKSNWDTKTPEYTNLPGKQQKPKETKDIEMQKIMDEFEDLNMEVKLIEDDPLETTRDS